MHGVKRLFAWMIPRFDRDALRGLARQPAQEGSLGRDARRARHRHHVPAQVEVRSRDAARAAEDHRPQEDRRAASSRVRRDDVRPDGGGDAGHSGDSARAREPDRHAVVSEGRRPRARALHRHRDRRLEEHRRLRGERAAGAAREGEGRLSGRAARGVQPPAIVRRDRSPRGASSASGRTISRSAPSRGCTSRRATRISSMPRGSSLDRKPNAKFFLVGEGPLRESLEAQARQLGLGDRFVFVGFARDVAAVLSAFDLSVFPSLWEGTPLTAFEALASAKPIVATDADGLLDILTDGRDARIVPKRDAARACRCDRRSDGSPGRTRAARRRRARHGAALRHHRLRQENGAAVRAPAATSSRSRRSAGPAARAAAAPTCRFSHDNESRRRHVDAAVRRRRAPRHRAGARAGAARRRARGRRWC